MKSYFKYFSIPFIITAILAVIALPMYFSRKAAVESTVRSNSRWDNSLTVIDSAGKMTTEETELLSEELREIETACQTDIIFITLYDSENAYLDSVRALADSFSEENGMGYDGPGGSALVFIDNWSRGGDGGIHSWISTTGDIRSRISDDEASEMLNVLDEIESDDADPYSTYSKLAHSIYKKGARLRMPYTIGLLLIVAVVISAIYIFINWNSKLGDVTVNAGTYLKGGKSIFKVKTDTFSHKTVSKRKIERSSGSGGGGGSHGGGGHSR